MPDSASAHVNPTALEIQAEGGGVFAITRVFTPAECERIIEIGLTGDLRKGVMYDVKNAAYVVDENQRRVHTSYHPRGEHTEWIFQRMDLWFHKAALLTGLEVTETCEDVKFMLYGPGDHFRGWHTDTGDDHSALRKLSMTIELSEPRSYAGGLLEFQPPVESNLRVGRGGAVIFPSHRYHRVSPVTQGTRYSLVNWISGPSINSC